MILALLLHYFQLLSWMLQHFFINWMISWITFFKLHQNILFSLVQQLLIICCLSLELLFIHSKNLNKSIELLLEGNPLRFLIYKKSYLWINLLNLLLSLSSEWKEKGHFVGKDVVQLIKNFSLWKMVISIKLSHSLHL